MFSSPLWANITEAVYQDAVHEPYLLLLEENQVLKEKLAEINSQINGVKALMDDLRKQIALKNDELGTLRNKANTEIEKAPVVGSDRVALADDVPYKVIDGHIDENTIRGWKTYRGIGACTACHGPAGLGGVGLNLLASVKEKDKDFFIKIIADGKKGTQMIPYKGNKAVMNNIDNIYAYFKARVDGVLGPENLIKYPLGKKE
jgi:mono/diheme cytochrome c family protein